MYSITNHVDYKNYMKNFIERSKCEDMIKSKCSPNEKLSQLQKQIETLTTDNSKLQTYLASLQKQHMVLIKNNQELLKNTDKSTEFDKLQSQHSSLKQKHLELESMCNAQQKTYQCLQNTSKDLKSKMSQIHTKYLDIQSKYTKLQAEYDEIKAKSSTSSMKSTMLQLHSKYNKLLAEYNELKGKHASSVEQDGTCVSKTEYDTLKSNYALINTRLQNLKSQNADLSYQIKELKGTSGSSKVDSNLNSKYMELKNKYKSLLAKLQSQKPTQPEDIVSNNDHVKLKSKYVELQFKYSNLQTKINEHKKCQQIIGTHTTQKHQGMSSVNQKLVEKNKQLGERNQQLEKQIQSLEDVITNLKVKMAKLENSAYLKSEIERCNNRFEKALASEKARYKSIVHTLMRRLQNCKCESSMQTKIIKQEYAPAPTPAKKRETCKTKKSSMSSTNPSFAQQMAGLKNKLALDGSGFNWSGNPEPYTL